jgi:hypothetical protein
VRGYIKALILTLICLTALIPLASSDPDGLEKVAETLGVEEPESHSPSPMPDYTVPAVENEYSSTLIAGVAGVFLVLGAAFVLGKSMTRSEEQ